MDGVPKTVIAMRLNEGGVLTPGKRLESEGIITHARLIGSGKWDSVAVANILLNEVYTGDLVQGKTQAYRRKQGPADRENWIVVRGTHEAIIDRETFDRVQEMLAQKKSRYKSFKVVPYTENVLRGRIFCGCCGRHMNRRRDNNKRYVYYCLANSRVARDACAADTRIYENELFDIILKIVHKEAEVILGNDYYRREADSRTAVRKAETERRIEDLRRETARNRSFMTGMYENFVSGVLTASEYHDMKREYEVRIEQAEQTVRELMESQTELEEQLEQYTSLADRLESLTPDSTLTAQLVDKLIQRVTVNSKTDVSIDFVFNNGFERLHEVMRDA